MLLDSDTALKIAHDIIHDANEFFLKWPLLLAESETAPSGFVDFEFSDGSILRMPCAWYIYMFSEGAIRRTIDFRKNGLDAIWKSGITGATVGAFGGLLTTGGVIPGVITTGAIVGITSDSNGTVTLEYPEISKLTGHGIIAYNPKCDELKGSGTLVMANCGYDSLDAPDAVLAPVSVDTIGISVRELTCSGERKMRVDRFNAWWPSGTPGIYERVLETDAPYTGFVPFDALSPSGAPIHGYDNRLVSNRFYPDWIYVGSRPGPTYPDYAWVPSATRPDAPFWQDSDGIYWSMANVTPPEDFYDPLNLIWPVRTCPPDGKVTVPPMKADADGMIVTVKALENVPVPICIYDRYEYAEDGTWSWQPGPTKNIIGPCICEFIAKRNFVWDGPRIIAVEYQLLPIGELYG